MAHSKSEKIHVFSANLIHCFGYFSYFNMTCFQLSANEVYTSCKKEFLRQYIKAGYFPLGINTIEEMAKQYMDVKWSFSKQDVLQVIFKFSIRYIAFLLV